MHLCAQYCCIRYFRINIFTNQFNAQVYTQPKVFIHIWISHKSSEHLKGVRRCSGNLHSWVASIYELALDLDALSKMNLDKSASYAVIPQASCPSRSHAGPINYHAFVPCVARPASDSYVFSALHKNVSSDIAWLCKSERTEARREPGSRIKNALHMACFVYGMPLLQCAARRGRT